MQVCVDLAPITASSNPFYKKNLKIRVQKTLNLLMSADNSTDTMKSSFYDLFLHL